MPNFDFSTLITDRSEADVQHVLTLAEKIIAGNATATERSEFATALKGAYGYEDLNRISEAVAALAETLEHYGYFVSVDPITDWSESDTPTPDQLAAYLADVREISTAIGVLSTTPALPADMTLSSDSANAIEKNLQDVNTLIQNMAQVFPISGLAICGVRNLAMHTIQTAKIPVAVPVSDPLTYTGNLQVFTFTNVPAATLATRSGATSGTDAGQYSTRWTLTDPATHQWADGTATAYKDVVTTIGKATPTVTAPTPKALPYTGSIQELINAGSTSGGTMEYSLDNASWSTSIPTGTAVGAYTVYYRVAGDANYSDVAPRHISAVIGKVTPTVTAPTPKSLTYTGNSQELVNAGSTTGGTMEYSLDNTSWSTSIPTGTTVGVYTVYYRVVGNASYNDVAAQSISASIGIKTLTITAKSQTITYGNSIATGINQVTVSGLANGDTLESVTLTASTANVTASGTITPSTAMVKNGGTDVTSNYTIAYVDGSLTINKAPASVTAAPTAKTGLTYTGNALELVNEGVANGGTMQYSLDGTNYSTNVPTRTNANTSGYTVYYKVVGDSNHSDTAAQTLTVPIAKADFTASVSISGYTYAGTKSTPAVSNNPGGGSVTFYGRATSSGSSTAWSSVTSTTYNAGTRYCYAVIAETTNYNGYTTANKSFTISKATQNVALSPTALTLDEGDTATITASWYGNGTLTASSSNTSIATVSVSGSTITVSGIANGSVTITANVSAGTNHNAGSKTASATVEGDNTNFLRFSSPNSFTLAMRAKNKYWNGTIQWRSGGNSWSTWDGTTTLRSSAGTIDLRGIGNTTMTQGFSGVGFVLTGTAISCTGNIETLLDYQTVASGQHPTMQTGCFMDLFYNCEALVAAPELPALTLTKQCYQRMFGYCTSLTTPPSLPATQLADSCYSSMFLNCTALQALPVLVATNLPSYCYAHMFSQCTSIGVSATRTGAYQYAYRIPKSGTGTYTGNPMLQMFEGTGGTITGTPTINTTYYTNHQPVS